MRILARPPNLDIEPSMAPTRRSSQKQSTYFSTKKSVQGSTHPNSPVERHFSASFQRRPLRFADGLAPWHIYHASPPQHEGVLLGRGEGTVDLADFGADAAEVASETVGADAVDVAVPLVTAEDARLRASLETGGHVGGAVVVVGYAGQVPRCLVRTVKRRRRDIADARRLSWTVDRSVRGSRTAKRYRSLDKHPIRSDFGQVVKAALHSFPERDNGEDKNSPAPGDDRERENVQNFSAKAVSERFLQLSRNSPGKTIFET